MLIVAIVSVAMIGVMVPNVNAAEFSPTIDYRIDEIPTFCTKSPSYDISDLLITGDSGPMHIAAAFNVPTISIFGPTKNDETSQWMNEKNIIVKKNLDCQPCMKRTCPLKHHNCMKLIEATEVLEAVNRIN